MISCGGYGGGIVVVMEVDARFGFGMTVAVVVVNFQLKDI